MGVSPRDLFDAPALELPLWEDAIGEAEEIAGGDRDDQARRVRNHMVEAFPGQ